MKRTIVVTKQQHTNLDRWPFSTGSQKDSRTAHYVPPKDDRRETVNKLLEEPEVPGHAARMRASV